MKNVYKIKSLFFVLIMMFLASQVSAEEQKKTFSESYNVNADAKVNISNEYGNVTIQTWEKNQVVVDVTITVDGKSAEKAQQIMDKIVINYNGSPTEVKVETYIKGSLNCNNCKLSIDYMVKMPATNQLKMKNTFGDAFIGDLIGATDLRVEYGSMELGKLENKANDIVMKFGDMEVEYLKAANLNMEYGSLEIGKADYLDLYVRFVSVEIGEVSELLIDAEYESAEIGSVDRLRGKLSFYGLEIDELFEKIDLTSSYGAIEITRVSGGFSHIDISNEFGNIDLGISSSSSYSLDAEASFGSIDFPESRAKVTRISDQSFESSVEAFIGDDSESQSKVILKVKNSSIDIH